MKINIRELNKGDKEPFLQVAHSFFMESYHKNDTLRLDKFWNEIEKTFKAGNVSIPCAFVEGELVGYAIINYNTEFKDEREGELSKLYVMPEYRATGVSRALAQVVVNVFDEWGCQDSHLWAAPQLEGSDHNIKLFKNLWARYGYQETGIIMTRKGENNGR